MAFENLDIENGEPEVNGTPPSPDSSNRTFLIAAGILGGIALLALICIALYSLVFLPRSRTQQANTAATRNAQNTEMALIITQTSAAFAVTFTPTVTPVPATATPTATAVVAVPTNTPVISQPDPRTATVAALLTQAAITTRTVVPTNTPRATALPTTGFAEDVGLPSMLGLAFALIVVIFLARRLRTAA